MKLLSYLHKRLKLGEMGLIVGFLVGLLMVCSSVMPLAAAAPGDGPGGVGETDGASALRWWFRTDAGVYADLDCTTLASTGGLVACWADQSGHGERVQQSDTEYQPVYRTTSRLEFDTAILSSTQPVQLFTDPSAGLSALVVFNTSSYSETGVLVNHGASNGVNTDDNFELGYTVGNTSQWGNFGLHRGDGNATVAARDTITYSELTLMSTLVLPSGTAPNNLRIYKDGLSLTPGNIGSGWLAAGSYPTTLVPLDIGARRNGNSASYPDVTPDAFHMGDIAEIIVYTTTLNSAQRTLVENYLAAKYDIALNIAAVKYASAYNRDVAGIGREADGMHTLASSAGLQLLDEGFLQDNGDYLLVGHDSATNSSVNTSLPPGVQSRWERVWYVDITDAGTSGGNVTLTFDFSDAGIAGAPADIYVLLVRAGSTGNFKIVQTSSYVVGDQVIFENTPALEDGWYYTLGEVANLDYYIADSYQSDGPAYDFEDIRSSGIPVTLGDEATVGVPIGFTFNFYDQGYTAATISSNGFVALSSGQPAGSGTPAPIPTTATPNGYVAGWWMNLNPVSGTVHYTTTGTYPLRTFIVQYTNVSCAGTALTNTFQIKLFESSDQIEVHYLSVNAPTDVSVGIEDQYGLKGLQYYYASAPLRNLAVRYARPKLLIEKTVNEPTPRLGDRITYTLIVRSNLTSSTTSTLLTDTLDAGLIFAQDAVTVTPARSFGAVFNGQVLSLRNFNLGTGERITFTLPVTVSAAAAPGVELFNRVEMTHTELSKISKDAVGVTPDDCWVRAGGETYNNLQQGIDAAAPDSEVKVAGYCLDVSTRNALAQVGYISQSLTLRGGYAPGDTDWVTTYSTRTTVLDARGDGRVLYVTEGVTLSVENLHLINGDARQSGSGYPYGGGIYANTARVTLNTIQLRQNLADRGGGAYVYSGTLALYDSQIFSNTVDSVGGGLLLDTAQEVLWDRNEVLSNTANLYGGGLYFNNIQSELSGTRFVNNRAIGGGKYDGGGGAYFYSSVMTLTANIVVSNTAFQGGGYFIYGSTVVVTDAEFTQNNAWGAGFFPCGGGGVFLRQSTLTLLDSDFISNTAAKRGAGVSLYEGTAILQDNRFVGNATPHGGGLYAQDTSTVTLVSNYFQWNKASTNGGGAYILSKLASTLTNNTFFSNTAQGNSGGVYMRAPLMQVVDNEFEANFAQGGGGGMYLESGTLILEKNRVWQNRTLSGYGGGGYLSGTSGRVMTNTWELNVSSGRNGGGLYMEKSGDTIVQNNDFLTNTAMAGGGASFGNGKLTLSANSFLGNIALSAGGGAMINGNTAGLQMVDNVFQANSHFRNDYGGGGIYILNSQGPVLKRNQIISNTSYWNGGGIYIASSYDCVVMTNTLISNTAVKGGGIYTHKGSVTLEGNTIHLNTTSQDGGGIYLYSPVVGIVSANVVLSNTANRGGGVYMHGGTASTLVDSNAIAYNTADQGGGLYAYSADQVRLNANRILTNTANNGGGIYLMISESQLTNNLLVGNIALSYGSGVYLYSSSPYILHTTFVGNTGGDGSGIYLIKLSNLPYSFPIITNTIMVSQTVGVTATVGNVATLNGTLWWNNDQRSGGAGTVVSNTNLSGDPLFVDPAAGDYHITLNSPAMNAGVVSGVATDIDGEVRPQANEYDLGADEYASGCFVKLNDAALLYDSIQDAVAASTQSTDLVKVAGACSVAKNVGGTVQTAYVNKSLTIQGGYTLTEWLNPDPTLYPTTLGARDLGRVLYVTNGANVTVEDLTISDGNGSVGGGADAGGGVYVNDGAALTLRDVTVRENVAGIGAGVYVANATLSVQASVIANNTATQGGGIYAESTGQVTVLRSTMRDNTATSGGGLYLAGGAATLRNNTWNGNEATSNGGAVYLTGVTSLVFEANMVRNNSAASGGGLYLYQSPVTLERNHFISNTVTYGGGLYLEASDATLINTLIARNTASAQGSGVYVQGSHPHFKHLTLATNTGGDGSGLLLTGSSTAWLTNTIIVQHTVGVTASAGSSAALNATLWGSNGWANGQDSVGTVISTTNYYGDPAFVNPAQMDYHLVETSAAIDRGLDTDVVLDIDGLTRGASPDLGADEYRTCWVRLNDSPADYVRVQDAINAGAHATDIIKIAGHCTSVTAQPRRDLTATGVVSQIAYLTRTLTLQGGYTSTNFTTPYPLTQPTMLAAKDRGRIIYVTGNIAPVIRDLTLVDGNAAGLGGAAAGDAGGGIYVISGTLTLSQSLLASNEGTYGGGLYVASGAARLYNAVIAQNNGTDGGGAYGTHATLLGVHTTWAENTGASGLHLTGNSTAALTNTILVSHTVGITATSGSAVNLTALLWNNTQNTGGAAGAFNVAQTYTGAPEFVAPAAYDYHIGSTSAAIDRGVAALSVDMDQQPRPIGAAADLGADEYPAGLELTKQLTPADVVAGGTITYTLWVTNSGLVAYRAYIRDILPAHVTPGGVEAWVVYLSPQDVWSQPLGVQVAADYSGWLTNTASVTTALGLTDIYTLTSLVRRAADLSIVKVGTPASLAPGQPLTYTLTYFNAGPSAASGVVITDLLSNDIISASVTSTPPLTPVNGSRYVWAVGDLPPYTGGEIVITASLRTGVAGNTALLNTARVAGDVSDDVSSNNQDDVTLTVLNVAPVARNDTATTPEDLPVTVNVLDNDGDLNGDELTITDLEGVTQGVATWSGALVTYTPTLNFNGAAVFTYSVTDEISPSVRARITITVNPVNDPPTAVDDSATTSEDVPVNIAVLENDSDADNPSAQWSVTAVGAAPSGAAIRLNATTVRYTPHENFHGTDAFTYTMSDGGGATATAWVTVTVTSVNDAPVAVNDNVGTPENTPRLIAVLTNDTDVDGDSLLLASVGTPTSGSATIQGNQVLYTPTTGFDGLATFSYTVSDGTASDEGLVTVDVGAPNQAPTATDDITTTPEDTPVDIAVLDNDDDPDNDPLFIVAVGGTGRAVIFNALIRYTPEPNFYGSESFTYTMSDGLLTDTAWVTVTVEPVNDVPVVRADGYNTNADTPLSIAAPGVLANDTDVEGATLSASLVGGVTHGALTLRADGSFVYTPTLGFTGQDAFTYRAHDGEDYSTVATVIIGVDNDPPVAEDDAVETDEDTPVDIPVLDNDPDPDDDPLFIAAVGGEGRAVIVGDLIRYTPAENFHGVESFTYTVSDGLFTDTAWVTVTVMPVNDAPVAVDDTLGTPAGVPREIAVLANDTDVDSAALTLASVGTPTSGSATIQNNRVLYTPGSGVAVFTYTVSDSLLTDMGRVTVTVGVENHAPVAEDDMATTPVDTPVDIAVLTNDTDPDTDPLFITAVGGAGRVVIAGTRVQYTPTIGFIGTDSFTYTVSDGLLTDTAWVTVTVGTANQAPVALDDSYTTSADTVLVLPVPGVLANDTDADGDDLMAYLVGAALTGEVTLRTDGGFTYTPTLGFTGYDTFTYHVFDGLTYSNLASVRINVGAANQPPTAADATVNTDEDTRLTGQVSASDPNEDSLIYTVSMPTLYGTLTLTQSTGAWLYTPGNRTATYQDPFRVIVSDGALTATATITIVVTADNDAPYFISTPITSATATTLYAYPVSAADPDLNDAVALITATVKPAWLMLAGTGATATLSGTPSAADVGDHPVTLEVRDGGGLTALQPFTITVSGPAQRLVFLPLVLRSAP